jgi:hypothetical protein
MTHKTIVSTWKIFNDLAQEFIGRVDTEDMGHGIYVRRVDGTIDALYHSGDEGWQFTYAYPNPALTGFRLN